MRTVLKDWCMTQIRLPIRCKEDVQVGSAESILQPNHPFRSRFESWWTRLGRVEIPQLQPQPHHRHPYGYVDREQNNDQIVSEESHWAAHFWPFISNPLPYRFTSDLSALPRLEEVNFASNGLRTLHLSLLQSKTVTKVNLSSNYIFKYELPQPAPPPSSSPVPSQLRKGQAVVAEKRLMGMSTLREKSFEHSMHNNNVRAEFFLNAFSHLYKRVCPSVRRSVGPSVRPSVTHELNFWEMGRIWTK